MLTLFISLTHIFSVDIQTQHLSSTDKRQKNCAIGTDLLLLHSHYHRTQIKIRTYTPLWQQQLTLKTVCASTSTATTSSSSNSFT